MTSKTLAAALALSIAMSAVAAPKSYNLVSPDGNISVDVVAGEDLTYAVSHKGDILLAASPISMELSDGTVYGGADKVSRVERNTIDRTIRTAVYKKAEVIDRCNEMILNFKGYSVVFRAYDDGVAYRFVSKKKDAFNVVSEQAVFSFPENWNIYAAYVNKAKGSSIEEQYFNSFENQYSYFPVNQWNPERLAFLPVMVEASKGRKINIMEADLLDYPGMYLYNGEGMTALRGNFAPYPRVIEQGGHNMLQGVVKKGEDYIARCEGPVDFPWRIISISENDVRMADNDMVYRLAKDPEDIDWGWVKPGKVAWEWWNDWNLKGVDFQTGVNNETYRYYIDFAASHGIEYVIMDEGWAVNGEADLFQIVPSINLPSLVAYAQKKGVGIILWAGYYAFERDMEKVCRHYSQMGVKGFKIDFMDRDDQKMVDFHRRAAAMAAKYHLLVDFHGTYKPTGLHRTYPNVINFEGVHGLEQMKWEDRSYNQVVYDVTMPFIRMSCGPLDYTQGAMRNAIYNHYQPVYGEPMSQGTRCRQLAEYVIFESPLNMLCDSPSNYMAEEECTGFISAVPTVWDETVAIDGKVAEYIIMARRKADIWYLGGMTDWNAREIQVPLSFLPDGTYEIELFRDGENAGRVASDYKKIQFTAWIGGGQIFSNSAYLRHGTLTLRLAPGGGFALKIVPVAKTE